MRATRKDRTWSTSKKNELKKKKKKTTTVVSLNDPSLDHFPAFESAQGGPSKSKRAPKGVKVERRASDEDHLFHTESPIAPIFGANSATPTTPFAIPTDFCSTSSSSTLSSCAPYDTPYFPDDVTVTPSNFTPNSHVFGSSYMDLDTEISPILYLTPGDPSTVYDSISHGSYSSVDGEDVSSHVHDRTPEPWASHIHLQDQSAMHQMIAQTTGYRPGPFSSISNPAAIMPLPLTPDDTRLLNACEWFSFTSESVY